MSTQAASGGPLVGALLVTLLCFAHTANAGEKKIYSLAVVPQRLSVITHKDWIPSVDRLSQRLDAKIELKLYRTIPRFEASLLNGIPDFAFMNPYHQVMAKKAQGYNPLVRSSQPLIGILVVRRDSAVKSVKDINGKTIAFPAPNAFGASLYMRALLSKKVGIKFMPNYVDSHNEVYRHVILGETIAGGGIEKTLEKEPSAARALLRVLFKTPKTAPHCLSAHPRVPVQIQRAVVKEILSLQLSADGKEMLDKVQLSAPKVANYRQDYQPLEKLGLEKFVVMSE